MVWTTEVSVSQLRQRRRWKVEFFATRTPRSNESGFPTVLLDNIVDERRETMDPQACPDDIVHYIGLENVESGTGDLIAFKPKCGKEIRSRSKRFYENDVLYGRLRPYLNKVFVAVGNLTSGICSGEFYVLVPRQDVVLPNFLRAILSSEYVRQHVASWQTGSALPRLQIEDLLAIEVPLPPLDEQRVYEDFLVSQNHVRRRLREKLETLETKIPRVFLDAVERGSTPHMSDGDAKPLNQFTNP